MKRITKKDFEVAIDYLEQFLKNSNKVNLSDVDNFIYEMRLAMIDDNYEVISNKVDPVDIATDLEIIADRIDELRDKFEKAI